MTVPNKKYTSIQRPKIKPVKMTPEVITYVAIIVQTLWIVVLVWGGLANVIRDLTLLFITMLPASTVYAIGRADGIKNNTSYMKQINTIIIIAIAAGASFYIMLLLAWLFS